MLKLITLCATVFAIVFIGYGETNFLSDIFLPTPIQWEGMRIYRDVAYGSRGDASDEGEKYVSKWTKKHPDGHMCHSHRTGQFCDILMSEKIGNDSLVYVNLHGGAWCQPFDKDGESWEFFKMLVDRGFIVVNANYQLQNDVTDPARKATKRPNATFRHMLRDVDVLGSFLATNCLPNLGIFPKKYVIGGMSAGAHLALLYAYDQDNPGFLKADLRHDLRIGLAVDVVGPVDLASDDFAAPFLNKKLPFGSMFSAEAADGLVTLLGWLTDDDLRTRAQKGDIAGIRETLARYSPINQVTPRTVPTILAYCQLFPFAKTDGCIPTSSYYDLCDRLKKAGVPYVSDIRTFTLHGCLRKGYVKWLADRISEFARK